MPKEEGVTASSHSLWGNLSDRVTEHSLGFGDVGLYWYSTAILGKNHLPLLPSEKGMGP